MLVEKVCTHGSEEYKKQWNFNLIFLKDDLKKDKTIGRSTSKSSSDQSYGSFQGLGVLYFHLSNKLCQILLCKSIGII